MRRLNLVFVLASIVAVLGYAGPTHSMLVAPSADLTTGFQVEDPANAGDFLFNNGNDLAPVSDNAAFVGSVLGQAVFEVGRFEVDNITVSTSFILEPVLTKPGEPDEWLAAKWTYAGPETVAAVALKAGPSWALFDYRGSTSPANMGIVSVACLFSTVCNDINWDGLLALNFDNSQDAAISHATGYVPLPAAVWLLMSGLLALFGVARCRRARTQA